MALYTYEAFIFEVDSKNIVGEIRIAREPQQAIDMFVKMDQVNVLLIKVKEFTSSFKTEPNLSKIRHLSLHRLLVLIWRKHLIFTIYLPIAFTRNKNIELLVGSLPREVISPVMPTQASMTDGAKKQKTPARTD